MPIDERVRAILEEGLPDSLILVGGQAALLYAERYAASEPGLNELAGITSRDSDFLGTWVDCEFLAAKLGTIPHRSPRKGGFLGLSLARIPTEPSGELDGDSHFFEVLGSVLGVRQQDIERTALHISLKEGHRFRVIHPVMLLEAKAANVISIDQNGRNDLAHLGMACFASRALLREMNADPEQGRNLVTLGNRILDLAESNVGRELVRMYRLDVSLAVPRDLAANHPSVENWLQRGVPDRLDRIEGLASAEELVLGTPLEDVRFAPAKH